MQKMLAFKNGRPYFKEIKRKPLAEKFFKYRSIRFFYNHFLRYVLALVPRLQYSEYGTPQTGEKWVAIWFSWLGHVFWDKRYLLDPKDRNFGKDVKERNDKQAAAYIRRLASGKFPELKATAVYSEPKRTHSED